MWSIGSIVFFMLFRKPAFFDQERTEGGKVDFPAHPPVSDEGISWNETNFLKY